eukprot:TRINITY_DN9236_c0_g1_i2.p2 TRINITY_DN9236_c0_g1~~TRINITY_DN9236_c0_g1_i2.p2  ORF type:complete len:136 (-),score=13.13 TRINITY_DN9236_c0_g1_i2:59-466(-)
MILEAMATPQMLLRFGGVARSSGRSAADLASSAARCFAAKSAEKPGDKPAAKEKKAKDPSAPKRAKSAYIYFSVHERPRVVADQPDIAFAQVGKVLGERWQSLTAGEKAPYEEASKKDQQRYLKEMEAYKAKSKQ